MTYQEQLKDPRWQRKRLEILERDEWTCQMCGDTNATLTVHHKSYKFNGSSFACLWDYAGEDLITLCCDCHESEEYNLKCIQKTSYFVIRECLEESEVMHYLLRVLSQNRELGGRITMNDIVCFDIMLKEKRTPGVTNG